MAAKAVPNGEAPTAERIRYEWGASLQEHMRLNEMSRKQLLAELEQRGHRVSPQALSQWTRGQTSPKPHHQAVLAAIFRVPVRSLFPIEAAA